MYVHIRFIHLIDVRNLTCSRRRRPDAREVVKAVVHDAGHFKQKAIIDQYMLIQI